MCTLAVQQAEWWTRAEGRGLTICCCLLLLQSGRVTLENAIHLVEHHPEWGAHVVYGDTDSMFVALPGRSRADAHRIG
jgi:DNA polymerase zeta